MGEEVHGSVTGGNGERLEVRLGSRSLGLTTRDLIPILLLLAGVVGGYLIYDMLRDGIALLARQQEQVLALLQTNQLKLEQAGRVWEDRLQVHTEALRQMFVTHEYNMGREGHERLPLILTPPPASKESPR